MSKNTLMKNAALTLIAATAGLLASCVDHRPIRNGLQDESVYIDKLDLTANNPLVGDDAPADDGWLFKVTTVKTSAPNVMGDVIFPGLESDLRYVKFRFQEGALQVLDGRSIQEDRADDPNDDLATQAERVMFEFTGGHVDVKLRESLDGERTNFLEENTELPWRERQQFKVDFENTNMEPASQLLWVYGLYANLCSVPTASHLVPDSVQWDAKAQYLSFTIDVTYQMNWIGWICTDLLHLYERDAQTGNVQYRFAFFRRGESDFEPEVIEEKALVNKKYGAFQSSSTFRDHDSGLVGSTNLLHRWNPKRASDDPVVFYFHDGFPTNFKPMYLRIASETNRVLEEAGATLRFDFRDCINQDSGAAEIPEDCERPTYGDPRFSFAIWHHSIDTTTGLLGYGPSVSDPRTGEIISASLNLYNVGLDRYRFYIEDYLNQHGGLLKPDADKAWEDIACDEGSTVAPGDSVRCRLEAEAAFNDCQGDEGEDCAAVQSQTEIQCKQSPRLSSQLFAEMRRVMESTQSDGSGDDFVPQPARAEFRNDYHKVLPELRYGYPPWNRFVYRSAEVPFQQLQAMQETDTEFKQQMQGIMDGENPFGHNALHTREGIESQLKFTDKMRDWKKNHADLKNMKDFLFSTKSIYTFDPNDAINAIALGSRRCVDRAGSFMWESDAEYRDRIVEAVVFNVAIHEFGHNLSLRHNFYGSVDAKHMHKGQVSASVMDYVSSWEEAGADSADPEDGDTTHHRTWGDYDQWALKWIYGSESVREEAMGKDLLYCTDEHRILSPLCRAHDLGITPAQITLNAIERYDWLYNLRNRRAYRKFWDTSGYVGQVYGSMYDIQRMWHLALFDWGGGGVQETLKRLDQVGGADVKTDQAYDEVATDFYNDVSAAVSMNIAFYDAVINQPASFRNYQTEFDPFYGDILRVGIIIDKLFSTLAFMDLQDVYYSPNVATYVSLWDAPFGAQNLALSQRVLDNMLGANYDTFAWFKYYALLIFASTSNTNLVGSIETKERIAIERFENEMEMREAYGDDAYVFANAPDNPQQTFVFEGEQFVYTFLPDRNWHLVSRKSRSPVSYQYLREYNESLNAGASDSLDNYGLKILLAYYEYFNNFVSF